HAARAAGAPRPGGRLGPPPRAPRAARRGGRVGRRRSRAAPLLAPLGSAGAAPLPVVGGGGRGVRGRDTRRRRTWLARAGGRGRGAVSVEAVARFFVGIHLVLLGTAALVGLDMWATLALNPPHLRLHPHQMTVGFAALAFVLAPLVAYGYFVSLAPRRRAVVARAAACLGLFLASLVQVEMAAGTVALLHRQRALRDDRADDGPTARRAVGDWEHYLATFPESDERAEVLWRVATTLVRLGEHERARAAFASLASLPADVPGPRWPRQARAILAHLTDPPGGARSDAAPA